MTNFAATLLTENLDSLRQKIVDHPLWTEIEQGRLPIERLRLFALQDAFLVKQMYRLDAMAIAGEDDIEAQLLLIQKLVPKVGGHDILMRFGEAVGLRREDFEEIEPLAGCMALLNYFCWMLSYGTHGERLAAISASEDIFIKICLRIAPSLIKHYGLTEEQVFFFSWQKGLEEHVTPIDQQLLQRYNDPADRIKITRAVRLSYEYELMFYDTILNTPLHNLTQQDAVASHSTR
jgi:Putative transcription activator